MSRKPNPIPILARHFGVKNSHFADALQYQNLKLPTLAKWRDSTTVPQAVSSRLFKLSMVHWGSAVAQHRDVEARNLLWDCYFKGYKPTVLHLLHFACFVQLDKLSKATKIPQGQLEKALRRPRLKREELRRIAKFYALPLRDAMQSPKNENRLWVKLDQAMKDRARTYTRGEFYD